MKKNIFIAIFASIIVTFIISFIPSLSDAIIGFYDDNILTPILVIIAFSFLTSALIVAKKFVIYAIPSFIILGIILCYCAEGAGWGGLVFIPFIFFNFVTVILIPTYWVLLKLFEYLENNIKYTPLVITICVLMLFISIGNIGFNKTNSDADSETDFIINRIHETEKVCIKRQEKYGVPFDMLIKTCDEDYEVKVSKKVCERLVNNKYNSVKYYGSRQYLDDAIVKSVSNDGNELTKKSCKKTNWIEFNIIPNVDKVKDSYNPEKVDKVDYMNWKGKLRTIQDVSIDMDMPLSKEERQRQNEKALKRLNNMNNNSNQTDNSNKDYSSFTLNF